MKLRGIAINVNYPDDEVEVAVPSNMTVDQLCEMIKKLAATEPDMTSFVITAAIDK